MLTTPRGSLIAFFAGVYLIVANGVTPIPRGTRVVIVYHEPGVRGSERELIKLLDILEGVGVTGAKLAPLNESIEARCWGAKATYLLMMGRGGHWLELRDACGVEPSVIPPWVTARSIAGLLEAHGARSLVLLYRRAKRNIAMYSADIAGIVAGLAARGYSVVPIEASRVDELRVSVDAVVPLTLLPGRLVKLAERVARELNARIAAPHFAAYGLVEVASWIASDLFRRV